MSQVETVDDSASAGVEDQTQQKPTESKPEGMKSLAELLAPPKPDNGDEGDSSDDDDAESSANDQPKGPPKTLDELAARVGMKTEDLYKITFGARGDGQPHSLGELKDLLADRNTYDAERMTWSESRASQQSEIVRDRNELTELVAALPEDLRTQKVRDAMRARYNQRVATERGLMLGVIPEWKKPDILNADLGAIETHLQEYGLDASFLMFVAGNHKAMRYVRENWLREQRVAKALAQIKETPKKPTPPGSGKKPGKPKQTTQPSSVGNPRDKLGQLFSTVKD